MPDELNLPTDMKGCQALILAQAAANAEQAQTNAEQSEKIAALESEMEKLRKLLSHFINGQQSEKKILSSPHQAWLPFDSSEEFQAARAEAEAEAEVIVQSYTVERLAKKKKRRNESFPGHLRREEQIIDADDSLKNCDMHGPRTLIGYDSTESLVRRRPDVYVLVKKYPKYACTSHAECGVNSPERPTSLVEGDRYSTSIAAAIIEAKWFHYLPIYRQQDLFAGSGWTPGRSTLLNIIKQVEFVVTPFVVYLTNLVRQDIGVGIDDTSCRMLLPKEIPASIVGDAKSQRLAEKVAEARAKGQDSLLAKMWVYSGLHLAPYNLFDFRVSRHRDGPDEFFATSRCKVQGDCFSGNTSVVIHSDARLEFVACWANAPQDRGSEHL